MNIFLGGTRTSDWRGDFKKFLEQLDIQYVDPVVEDWTPDCALLEEKKKKECSHILFVITPNMKGFYSIWEMSAIAHTNPEKLIVCFVKSDFIKTESMGIELFKNNTWDTQQIRSIAEIMHRCAEIWIPFFWKMEDVKNYIKSLKEGSRYDYFSRSSQSDIRQ